ncbi:FadR/GntR family transcriptional regulator [Sinomonas susongensis]|uniref:FadR/GntR family transcriptional regulator n=1 Tax=Sinomonas susongensis TaxID=1324851 RepID=UPI0011097C6E|nr:FadR/GntR family transcriptional regulator [Sinomonas susongensis]
MTSSAREAESAKAEDRLLALADHPVQRMTLSSQVAERLIQQIGRDGLRAGDDLPSETRLAAAFSVSRPVVREALRHLAALRMVELSNGKPAKVMPVTPDLLGVYFEWAVRQDIDNTVELHELRQGVEGMCAELAASRATEEEREQLRALAAEMRTVLHDTDQYAELDARLHLSIIDCAHNSLLRHLAGSIRGPLRTSIQTGLALLAGNPERLERMQHQHEDIVQAIIARDPATARTLMDRHIGGASRRIADEAARNKAHMQSEATGGDPA